MIGGAARWVAYVGLCLMGMWVVFLSALLGIGVVAMVREWWLERAR